MQKCGSRLGVQLKIGIDMEKKSSHHQEMQQFWWIGEWYAVDYRKKQLTMYARPQLQSQISAH